jgi:phage tail-like protein
MFAELPASFRFVVRFTDQNAGSDTSFLEVSGIGSEMDTTAYAEGGENRFVHALPVGVKHTPLVLKRGIADLDSPLVKWCRATLEGGFGQIIETRDLTVTLLDAKGDPLRGWSFFNAFPKSWQYDPFQGDKGSVAVEKITLSYTTMTRNR